MIVIQITITLCLCQLSTSPSFQPNKITFDTRVVWPRKQGRGRGGILTFSKLSVQVIKLKEKHFFQRSCQLPIFPAGFPQLLVISQNIGGQLQVHMDWPSPLKNKGVFFVKREKVPLPDQMSELLNWMCCGDIHPNPLGT